MHYPFEQLPEPGTTFELIPGIAWVRMPLPYALNHVNLWLLQDGGGWAAVDSGLALDEIKAHWQTLLSHHSLSRLFVTHCHPDHLGLAAWLEAQTGVRLWMTQGEFSIAHLLRAGIDRFSYPAMVDFFARHGLDAARQQALSMRGNAFLRGVPDIPQTFVRLVDGECIDIGGHEWRVITGTGHSPEHAALYCEELRLLISGDMLLPRITTNVFVIAATPEADALQHYLDSIDRFLALPADTLVLPSHGQPFRGLHDRVDQLHRHHRQRCNLLLQACKTPKSAAELLPVLFDRDISDPHQLQFAMGETIAHLNHLDATQKLVHTADQGIKRYLVVT